MKKEDLPQLFQDRIERFNRLFLEETKDTDNPHNFEESNLYEYEMFCIEEALKIIEFIKDKETYDSLLEKSTTKSFYEFVEFLKEKGIQLDDGHSGNTMSQSFSLAECYLTIPELTPYMHGSLAALVGDSGYYDDRSDLPKHI